MQPHVASEEEVHEVDSALQHRHDIATIHEKNQAAARRVGVDTVLRVPVDGEIETKRIVQFSLQLASKRVEIRRSHQILLPPGLQEVVCTFECECAINLLSCDLERCSWIEVKEEGVPGLVENRGSSTPAW